MSYKYASLVPGSPFTVPANTTQQYPIDPKQLGSSVLLKDDGKAPADSPYNGYFKVIAFVGVAATATTLTLEPGTYVHIALPHGFITPLAEILAVATNAGSGGPPGGVGPT